MKRRIKGWSAQLGSPSGRRLDAGLALQHSANQRLASRAIRQARLVRIENCRGQTHELAVPPSGVCATAGAGSISVPSDPAGAGVAGRIKVSSMPEGQY